MARPGWRSRQVGAAAGQRHVRWAFPELGTQGFVGVDLALQFGHPVLEPVSLADAAPAEFPYPPSCRMTAHPYTSAVSITLMPRSTAS